MDSIKLNVPSITCSTCASKITEGLKGMKGIRDVAVDLKSQSVQVSYDANEVKPQDIKREISSMGYEVI